ncbi:MAG: lysophospholipid acyltransferase family protein [Desulfobulbaceae bacterium]|uniref:Lysophospholipid acyltransferase family protein n=1 Tax=Candidatus Desulfatifera sulfidica TaxID=2841691 RepID=A0A8J6T9X8_9BACT|nr:lysophospholipid acyltransferase family protein [Candidatus Desulfatifera sulfidica]
MKDGFLYRVSLRLFPLLFLALIRVWFATCRVRIHGREHREVLAGADGPAIGVFWHYELLPVIRVLSHERGTVMVSTSRDAEYVSRLLVRLGFETVRGSRNRGGVQALKGLIKALRAGRNVGLVADGSQGPARIAQPGAVLLASRTGAWILPVISSCGRYKRFRSWDGTILPLPFSRIDFFFGEPYRIERDLDVQGLEKERQLLEEKLNQLYSQAWRLYGKNEH